MEPFLNEIGPSVSLRGRIFFFFRLTNLNKIIFTVYSKQRMFKPIILTLSSFKFQIQKFEWTRKFLFCPSLRNWSEYSCKSSTLKSCLKVWIPDLCLIQRSLKNRRSEWFFHRSGKQLFPLVKRTPLNDWSTTLPVEDGPT